MNITIGIILFLTIVVALYLNKTDFGRRPGSKTKKRLNTSPNFNGKTFDNLSETPSLAEGESFLGVLYKFIFKKDKNNRPDFVLPSEKHDLKALNTDENLLVWFGHSSYFMQVGGKKYLVDPVFSGNASPLPGTNTSFKGSDVYTADDMPGIDYLVITHDHWDHLDYPTIKKLRHKVKHVITGLGVGEHFLRWKYSESQVTELDWNVPLNLGENVTITSLPARHFSGRGFARNTALWASFALNVNGYKIYIGGDSGYDVHFKVIGDMHGPFNLAILECGQYNKAWRYIHMLPEETVLAAQDLRAEKLLPVNHSKFALALHAWDEPLNRVIAESERKALPLIIPVIGKVIRL